MMMSGEKKQAHFGLVLKELLEERSMTMRNLSEHTGIDTATISRIINGKRKANLQHLEKIADCLQVPISKLFTDSIHHNEQEENDENTSQLAGAINFFLSTTEITEEEYSTKRIEKELKKYEQFAQTEEGKKLISNDFKEKLKRVDSVGPFIERVKKLYEMYRLEKGNASEMIMIGSALLYFIIPIDVIPDYIFPIGYLDDALAIKIVAAALMKRE